MREKEEKEHLHCEEENAQNEIVGDAEPPSLGNLTTHNLGDIMGATPCEGKNYAKDEFVSDAELHILRSSNSVCSVSQDSVKLKGTDLIPRMKKKRSSRSGEAENNAFAAASSTLTNGNKIRKSDPPRVARLASRTTITKPVTAAQGPLPHKRTSREQAQGLKERDRKKLWVR